MINQGPASLGQKSARELTVHVDRLAYIFRYKGHVSSYMFNVAISPNTCGSYSVIVNI